MEFKKKLSGWCKKVPEIWAAFLAVCGVIWERTKLILGKVKLWLEKSAAFVMHHGKRIAGKTAVLVLKARKWCLQKSAGIRSWWHGWKGRAWLNARWERCRKLAAQVKEKLPKPVEVPDESETEMVVEQIAAPAQEVRQISEAPAKTKAAPAGFWGTLAAVGRVIKNVCIWIFRLRKFIMAAPVVFYALKLAIANSNRLPETVGMEIQASGEFARMVSRQSAVMGPLALTAFCLGLMFCSRKTLMPWLISIFTLVLPILIWMTNYYA